MGKRDVASFVIICGFAVSLVATSKPRDEEEGGRGRSGEGGFASANAVTHDGGEDHDAAAEDSKKAVDGGKAALAAVLDAAAARTLPDTSAWKPFVYAPSKLVAKTPPNAEVTCARVVDSTMCVLTKSKKTIAVFTTNTLGPKATHDAEVASLGPKPEVVFNDEFDLAHVEGEKFDTTCDFVASSPAGLIAVTRESDKLGKGGQSGVKLGTPVTIDECLEAIAFARTLKSAP